MKSLLLLISFFFATLCPVPTVVAQFLAGSEARNFEREAKAPSGSVFDAAMTADMNAASGNMFQIDSFKTDKITNAPLRKHINKFLGKPIVFKLSKDLAPRKQQAATTAAVAGNTYRAFVKTPNGIKLRGFWRRGPDTATLISRDLMELSYDEAIRRRGSVGSTVEFEVQLPPLPKAKTSFLSPSSSSSASLFALPSIVYSIVLGTGTSNREASVVKSVAMVKIYPKGTDAKGFSLGKTTICQPMKAGIVDPSWVKGKTIFRRGRPVGQL